MSSPAASPAMWTARATDGASSTTDSPAPPSHSNEVGVHAGRDTSTLPGSAPRGLSSPRRPWSPKPGLPTTADSTSLPCRVEHPPRRIRALRTTSKAPSGRSEIVTVLGTCPAALTSRTVDDRFHSTSMVPSSALVPTWLSLMSTDAAAIGAPASSSTRSVYGVRTSSSDQPAHKAQTMVSATSKRKLGTTPPLSDRDYLFTGR